MSRSNQSDRGGFFLPRSISAKKNRNIVPQQSGFPLNMLTSNSKSTFQLTSTTTHRTSTQSDQKKINMSLHSNGTGSLTDRMIKPTTTTTHQSQHQQPFFGSPLIKSQFHTRVPSQNSQQAFSEYLSPRKLAVNQLNTPRCDTSSRFDDYIDRYIDSNPLFSAQEELFNGAEYIGTDVKQSLLTIGLISSRRTNTNGLSTSSYMESTGTLNGHLKTNSAANLGMTSEVKNMLFSMLDRLQKEILQPASSETFTDSLITESVQILNATIPFIVRKIAETDFQSARFCEGLFKYYVLFMDSILSRINKKIKQEFSSRIAEINHVNCALKIRISALSSEIASQRDRAEKQLLKTNRTESSLKEEITHLKAELMAVQSSIADLSNLDFAPKQLEKMAGTTKMMTEMIRIETAAQVKSELQAESQLLQLSNVLLAASRKRIDNAQVQIKNFGLFTASHTNLTGRLFGEHPFSACFLYSDFTIESPPPPPSKQTSDQTNVPLLACLIQIKADNLLVQKTILHDFYMKHLVLMSAEHTQSPAEQLIDYMRIELHPGDFKSLCISLKQILTFLKDTITTDLSSRFFAQLFGILGLPFPTKEQVTILISLTKKLQMVFDDHRVKKSPLPASTDKVSNSSNPSLSNFDSLASPLSLSSPGSTNKFKVEHLNLQSPHSIEDIIDEQFHSELPIETFIFEEIPPSIILGLFPAKKEPALKAQIPLTNVSAIAVLNKVFAFIKQDSKEQIAAALKVLSNKLESDDSFPAKLQNIEIERFAEKFNLKYTAVLSNIVYFFNEELSFKRRGQTPMAASIQNNNNNNIPVELTQSEFAQVIERAILNLLDLQKLHTYPFAGSEPFRKDNNNLFPESGESDEANMSVLSPTSNSKSAKKALARSFKKIQIKHSFSKQSIDTSMVSNSDRQTTATPQNKEVQKSKQPSLIESQVQSKFSKFKK